MTITLTDELPANIRITDDMGLRIQEGRLDWLKDVGWHDPRGRQTETHKVYHVNGTPISWKRYHALKKEMEDGKQS